MNAARVTIYTLSLCGPCRRARRLLQRRGIPYSEVCGDDDPDFDRLLLERTGALTVPQVVIDGVPIGGADSLERLDRLGVLAELVGDTRFPLPRIVRRLSARRVLEMYLSGGKKAGISGPPVAVRAVRRSPAARPNGPTFDMYDISLGAAGGPGGCRPVSGTTPTLGFSP
jgi:glutaredoxin 3